MPDNFRRLAFASLAALALLSAVVVAQSVEPWRTPKPAAAEEVGPLLRLVPADGEHEGSEGGKLVPLSEAGLVAMPSSEPAQQAASGSPGAEKSAKQAAPEEKPLAQTPASAAAQTVPQPEPEKKRELTPALLALRDRVQRVLSTQKKQVFSAREQTATEIMLYCLAFGCDAEVERIDAPGKRINGITCLCWNYACGGYQPLGPNEGRVAARVGYGLQEHPGQLLAVLAMSYVPVDYPIRLEQDIRKISDLVEDEKLNCRPGIDMSWRLIGLSGYLSDGKPWKNSLGDEWSIERIVREEMSQPVVGSTPAGVQRLLGLAYAMRQRMKSGSSLEETYVQAERFLNEYVDYALKLQNSDGSWGPRYLGAREATNYHAAQFQSTGHILEWLAVALPHARLEEPSLVRSVEYVTNMLASGRYASNLRSLSTQEIGAVMHALHALTIYDSRLFQGAAAPQTPAAAKPKDA